MKKKCDSCGKTLEIQEVYCGDCTKREKDSLLPSEAIYGFCAWLTTRKEVTKMGSNQDSAIIAELIGLYCKTNDLSDPRKDYQNKLIFPTSK